MKQKVSLFKLCITFIWTFFILQLVSILALNFVDKFFTYLLNSGVFLYSDIKVILTIVELLISMGLLFLSGYLTSKYMLKKYEIDETNNKKYFQNIIIFYAAFIVVNMIYISNSSNYSLLVLIIMKVIYLSSLVITLPFIKKDINKILKKKEK